MAESERLWDIDDRVLALEEALAGEEDDAVLAEFAAELDTAREQLKEKVDATAALIRRLEAVASARKEEGNRLLALAKSDQAKADRIEAFLLGYFRARGLEKMDTRRYRVSVVANGGKIPVEITGAPEDFPEEFRRVKVELDKEALREALEAGEVLEGARLGERGYRLSSK